MNDPNADTGNGNERPGLLAELPRALASIAVSIASICAATLVFLGLPYADGEVPWLSLALAGFVFAGLATTGGLILLPEPSRSARRRVLSRVLILASLVLLAANATHAGARLLCLAVVACTSAAILTGAERIRGR